METRTLEDKTIEQLKCGICNKVLSCFPIHASPNGDNVCGRCTPPPNSIHIKIYEIVSQNILFPCCYEREGCLEKLIPTEVYEHEKDCFYQNRQCPSGYFTNCTEEMSYSNLIKHFNDKHPGYFLEDDTFKIDVNTKRNYYHLVKYGQEYFPFEGSFDHKKKLFKFKTGGTGYSCKLKLTCENKVSDHQYDEMGETVEDEINLKHLLAGRKASIFVKVCFEPNENLPTVCFLRDFCDDKCRWAGKRKDLVKHCKDMHLCTFVENVSSKITVRINFNLLVGDAPKFKNTEKSYIVKYSKSLLHLLFVYRNDSLHWFLQTPTEFKNTLRCSMEIHDLFGPSYVFPVNCIGRKKKQEILNTMCDHGMVLDEEIEKYLTQHRKFTVKIKHIEDTSP